MLYVLSTEEATRLIDILATAVENTGCNPIFATAAPMNISDYNSYCHYRGYGNRFLPLNMEICSCVMKAALIISMRRFLTGIKTESKSLLASIAKCSTGDLIYPSTFGDGPIWKMGYILQVDYRIIGLRPSPGQ